MNEFSLKILAYIIKGFFLAIKKSYENFAKDLEDFIDVNVKGNKKVPRKNGKKKVVEIEENNATGVEKVFTFQNLSLFSENTQFEKFLEDTNMTEKIDRTLKRISKKNFL
jgi:hypothetical protein